MLRNKYVIAALGAALLVVAAYNVAFFKTQSAKRNAGAAAQAPAVAGLQRPKASAPPQVMTSRPAEEWRRDPFWYPQTAKHAAPGHPAAAPRPSSGLRLEATMIRDGKGRAIISGHMVGVGERLGGYVVAEIGDLFVRLKGPGGMKKLSMTTDTSVKE
jgi:hypothetical protein